MLNTNSIATATFPMRDGAPVYSGSTMIAGVPGQRPRFELTRDTEGATCGTLLPTGNAVDTICGVTVTCIDNGMPVVIMRADDVGITGYESPAELEANAPLRKILEEIRLIAGRS